MKDLRYGLRMLIRNPTLTLIVVGTLALGIGANTVIFSVVYGVLLKPLPYKDSDRLMLAGLSIPDYRDFKEANRVFDEVAVYATNLYNVGRDGETEQMLGAVVSPELLSLLGTPLIGRTFRAEDDRERLAVISYRFWRSRFGGNPGVLGSTIDLSGRAHTIIGVMPSEFQFPSSEFVVWVTFGSALAEAPAQVENRGLRIFRAVGHLKPGVTADQAQADVDSISARLEKQFPQTNAGIRIRFVTLYERLVGDVRPALLVLLAAVGLVLLIACTNVANLLLSRMIAREREIAIRIALGARSRRIIRQLLTESGLLAALGGVGGLILAAWLVELIPQISAYSIPRADSIRIGGPVLLFTAALASLTGLVFGLAPAFQATRVNLNESLKEGGRGTSAGYRARRIRGALVVAEVAIAIIVMIGAGLLTRSLSRLLSSDAGFVAENLLTTNVQLVEFKEPQRRAALLGDVLDRLRQIPGVETAGAGSGMPPETPQRATAFQVEGVSTPGENPERGYFLAVTPNYFGALGARLVAGREFDSHDLAGGEPVVIINDSLARRLFPDGKAVGKRVKLSDQEQTPEWRSIVGVVGDIKYSGLDDPAQASIYTPFAQTPFLWAYVFVRTVGNEARVAGAIRTEVAAVDSRLTAARIRPMQQVVAGSVAQPRFNMVLLSAFGLLALLLSSVGIYGVISYAVVLRTHEIGVRMALGAGPGDIARLLVAQGLRLTSIGIVIGLAGAFALTRVMQGMLFGISSSDPVTFATISLLLSTVAAIASYIPARRATAVDPLVALRHE